MANELGQLGELEGAVLEALWSRGELSTPAVQALVGEPRGLAYTTVLTVLQRLHKKGLADRREEGRSHVYFAAVTREEFAITRGQRLATVLSSLGEAGVGAFLDEATRLDPEVIRALRARLGADQ